VRPYLEKTLHKNRAGGVVQGEGPEFKPQYHKKKKRAQIDPKTIIVGDFRIPLSPIDSDKKINKEISELNDTIDQRDLTDISGIFNLTAIECTFISAAHRTLSKISSLRYKKTKITS
jgi:hypothetical protein